MKEIIFKLPIYDSEDDEAVLEFIVCYDKKADWFSDTNIVLNSFKTENTVLLDRTYSSEFIDFYHKGLKDVVDGYCSSIDLTPYGSYMFMRPLNDQIEIDIVLLSFVTFANKLTLNKVYAKKSELLVCYNSLVELKNYIDKNEMNPEE